MINIIKSKDNDKIKYTKSLLKTKGRNKEKKFIIEGYRILTLALECDAKLEYVFINEDFEKKQEHRDFLIELENISVKVWLLLLLVIQLLLVRVFLFLTKIPSIILLK